uniref:Macrophage-expressed gene 1 protein n=1 Tax=Panagrellus redivivus TaxID=6233 RepID=A0A7E4URB5_PANRE
MAFLFRCLVFACFAIARTISYDNEVAFEGLNTLLKKTPIAPAKLCISNLAKFVGPGETSPQEALGAYLGRGYDPLTDKTKFSVFDDSYANCNVSVDNKYIVPDFYRTELLKEGNCDKSTQVYSTYMEYQTSEESGIGAKGQGSKSGITLGGSFSKSSQETKTNMEKQERSLILMKLWYKKYRFEADIGAKFSHAFGDRIQAVTTAFKNGLKRMTRYLVEEIYRDYGTHVVNSAVLGVQLERRVFISSSVMSASKEKADSFKIGVSGSMRKEDKSGGGSYGQKDTSTSNSRDELSQIDRKDFISVLGGPNYKDLASDNVEDLLKDVNLAALSRDTTPIYKMINFATLQGYNLTQTDIETIQNLFREVYNELLERNMHPGCTDREYYNFDFQANTDDATCDSPRCQWKDIGLQCNEDKGAT